MNLPVSANTDKFLARHHSLRIHYEGSHNLHLTPPPIPHLTVLYQVHHPTSTVDEKPNILGSIITHPSLGEPCGER